MAKKPKENLAIREAELKKTEEMNRREKKALEDKAELVRQRRELEAAENEPEGDTTEGAPLFGYGDQGFMDVLSSLSDQGSVHVYRTTNQGLKKVAQFPVVDMPSLEQQMEKIAFEYGGGSFTLRVLQPNGQIAKTKTLSFDEKAYTKPADPAHQEGVMQDRLFQMMVESRRESTELMKTFLMAQAQNKPASPFGNMTVADIMALFKGNSSPVDMTSVFNVVTRALTMGKELAEGKSPTESGTGGEENVLKDLVAPFLGLLQNITAKVPAAQRPAPLPAPVRASMPAAARPANPPAVPEVVGEEAAKAAKEEVIVVDPSIQSIKSSFAYKIYVPSLLKAAKDAADPAEVAEDILNTVPETHHGILLKLMGNPDVVEYLAAFEPEARTHAEWVKKVAAEVLAQYADEEDDGGDHGDDNPEPIRPSGNGHSEKVPPNLQPVPAGA